MKRFDPEARRRAVLDAALAEFAAHGRAGARVERIAERAGCSVGLLYRYYGNKAQIFAAVFDDLVAQVDVEHPWDPCQLPGWAASIAAAQLQHPHAVRLALWRLLEAPIEHGAGAQAGSEAEAETEERPDVPEHLRIKLEALGDAQSKGLVAAELDPAQLLVLVTAVATMWSSLAPELASLVPDEARRLATVEAAVDKLLRA